MEDLEKASESANHENGLLRAQVDRLQTELKEYRKRLSLNNSTVSRSPPQTMGQSMSSKANWDINNNFQFEFPTFGAEKDTRAAKFWPNKRPTTYNDGILRQNSYKNSSPKTTTSPTRAPSQPKATESTTLNTTIQSSGLFSPSLLQNAGRQGSADYVSFTTSPTANPRSKSGSADITAQNVNGGTSDYTTASPSISSISQNGLSSCATTPEQSAGSPEHRKGSDPAIQSIEGEKAFCKEFQTACGNKENPVPPMMSSISNETSARTTVAKPFWTDFQGIDWLASQNGGAFDPVLFGDYRDPQETIMNADFGGFFNDAFPIPDFSSPLTTPHETNLPRKKDLMQEIEDQQEGKESEVVVPADAPKQFLTCNMLWSVFFFCPFFLPMFIV